MSMQTYVPLGACELEYQLDGSAEKVILGLTLEETETSLTTSYETSKILMDQFEGPFLERMKGGENPAQVKATVYLEPAILPKICSAFEAGKVSGVAFAPTGTVKYGRLKVHPIEAGTSTEFDVKGNRVKCTANVKWEYKKEGKVMAELIFDFAADLDKESPTYRKILSIGNFS